MKRIRIPQNLFMNYLSYFLFSSPQMMQVAVFLLSWPDPGNFPWPDSWPDIFLFRLFFPAKKGRNNAIEVSLCISWHELLKWDIKILSYQCYFYDFRCTQELLIAKNWHYNCPYIVAVSTLLHHKHIFSVMQDSRELNFFFMGWTSFPFESCWYSRC